EIMIVTGGLGPTLDDLSRDAAARVLGVELYNDPASLEKIEEFFRRRQRLMPANNTRQAQFPAGSRIIANPYGSAPGFSLTIGRGRFYFLPGVPGEMKKMFQASIVPELEGLRPEAQRRVRTLTTYGLGESALEEKLGEAGFSADFPEIRLGYRAAFPEVQVKLYLPAARPEVLTDLEKQALRRLQEILGRKLVSAQGLNLAQTVAAALSERRLTLALAESCTGGLLANQLTNIPGSSAYFLLGAVTYANAAKERVLGVKPALLERYGAVHEKTATAMAEGAQRVAGADYGLATTGIAGPDGGSPDKPVGTVCIGLAGPRGSSARSYSFTLGSRLAHKQIFAAQALNCLRLELAADCKL
ncbi:MAG: CinA family nicotinamide mononucleotide deamidase-related protein, partial [Deltaproteobacteria bacterium]|nr:CinA family nicotinamide mononucleotide deamidase-related protein [Deltaproteobacteria bacterium]